MNVCMKFYLVGTQISSKAGMLARTSSVTEPRGVDGLNHRASGLDHGVFVPFRLMFGDEFMDIPIIEVSIDSSLDPEINWAVGRAVKKLRSVSRR